MLEIFDCFLKGFSYVFFIISLLPLIVELLFQTKHFIYDEKYELKVLSYIPFLSLKEIPILETITLYILLLCSILLGLLAINSMQTKTSFIIFLVLFCIGTITLTLFGIRYFIRLNKKLNKLK